MRKICRLHVLIRIQPDQYQARPIRGQDLGGVPAQGLLASLAPGFLRKPDVYSVCAVRLPSLDIPLASRLVLQLFWEYSHGESLVLITMSQKHDLHACIVGHSFVRRLQDAVGGAPRILSHRDAAALNAPDWFRVQDHYHRVDFFGQSGYTVSMLQRDITSAGLLYPDVVIIESGSNDLCYRECDIDALVTGLFSYASMLREVHRVRLVIMASVLNRDRCRQVSPAQFRSRAFAFNRKMAARAARTPGVKFEVLHGFWRDPLGAPLPVSASRGGGWRPSGPRAQHDRLPQIPAKHPPSAPEYGGQVRQAFLLLKGESFSICIRYLTNGFGPLSTTHLGTLFATPIVIKLTIQCRHTLGRLPVDVRFNTSCIMIINHRHICKLLILIPGSTGPVCVGCY